MMKRFLRDERGATAIEYALLGALISVAIIAAVSLLGTALNETYSGVATKVGDAI